jgi:hypothetical protein
MSSASHFAEVLFHFSKPGNYDEQDFQLHSFNWPSRSSRASDAQAADRIAAIT